jgi:pyruvate-formate lyase
MSTAVSKTNESTGYLMDPASAGVTLGAPGMPTEQGWKFVTPEMWKFRWGVADKIMVIEPDYYKDRDWYVDTTKADIVSEMYAGNPNMHPADLAADALIRYLDNQRIDIRPYDYLLGLHSSDPHGILYDPLCQPWTQFVEARELTGKERICRWDGDKKVVLDDERFARMEKLAGAYNTVFKVKSDFTDEEFQMYYCPQAPGRYFEPVGTTGMRANPDHDWYLDLGLRKIVELKQKRMEWFEQELKGATGQRVEELKDIIINSKATIRAVEGVIRWIKRHAAEARQSISRMPDSKAKAILEQSAANCEWVAENAPRTFGEALQLYWSCFMVDYCIETPCATLTFLPDRIFWKWYEKDVVNDKSLSRLQAGEMLACYAAKFHEIGGTTARFGGLAKAGQGTRDFATFTIGGQLSDGSDGVNDLTMLILDVWDGYRFHYPDIKFRWCTKTKKHNLKRVVEVMRSGMGSPSIRNDEVAIPSMLDHYRELTLEEVRNWGIVGCNTPGTTTNSKGACRRDAFYPQVTKALEFALFDGRDPEPGFEWFKSVKTGDSTRFIEFEDFYQAWLKQWEWIVTTEIKLRSRVYGKLKSTLRRPFLSALYKGCLETGNDIMLLDMPGLTFQSIVGWVDSIDSVTAVKYCVFDQKKYTMSQLVDAIKADWVGFDQMREDFKNAPKFGNDNDFADSVMIRATKDVYDIGRKIKDDRGQFGVYPNALPISMMFMAAPFIGALPNGRKRGEALCDGGINPHADFDLAGPWARMNSAMKIDQAKFKAYIYNQKFDYPSVAGEAGLDKMTDFALAGLNGGMSQLQFNMVSRDMLLDAKVQPKKYPYLSVRVSGYTAFFVGLPEFMQDAVITRVDHKL